MERVKEKRISNKKVRQDVGNIPSIPEIIRAQKLKFVGHIIREIKHQTVHLQRGYMDNVHKDNQDVHAGQQS